MFKTICYKRFSKIALLILVGALTVYRSRVSEYLLNYISVTGMCFSLDTRNVSTYTKTHQNLWENFHTRN